MSSDPISDILMATIRCVMAVVVNRSHLKFLAFSGYVLLCALTFMMQPSGAEAQNISNMDASPDEVMSRLKTRITLTEEQEAKMRPIIEESIRKRHEIARNGSGDRQAVKSQLQELRWSTDMRIGKILTEEQMKEYQKLKEEQKEKKETDETHGSRGSRSGGLHSF